MYENLTQNELLKEFKSNTGNIKELVFEEFFVRFTPLLEKYAWKLGDKDNKYFLAEALYNALLKIPYELDRFKEDKYIINYIYKSIKAEYIKLSKYNSKYNTDDNIKTTNPTNEIEYNLLLLAIKSILNEDDFKLFKLRFINNFSEIEIAHIYNISRQAINKKINNIRNWLVFKLLKG